MLCAVTFQGHRETPLPRGERIRTPTEKCHRDIWWGATTPETTTAAASGFFPPKASFSSEPRTQSCEWAFEGERMAGGSRRTRELCPGSGPTPCHKPARCVLRTKPLQERPQDARSGAKCGPRCFEVSEALSLQSLTLLLLRGAGALSSPGNLSQTLFWGPRLSECNPVREAVETSGSEGHLQSRKRHLRVCLCNKHLCEVCSAARDPL